MILFLVIVAYTLLALATMIVVYIELRGKTPSLGDATYAFIIGIVWPIVWLLLIAFVALEAIFQLLIGDEEDDRY